PDHLVSGFWGAYSADGIHWTDAGINPVLKDPGDVGNFVWDAHAKRYIGYPKVFAPVRGFNRRSVGVTATTDFERWPSAQLILVPDKRDDYWIDGGNQRTEFYGLTAFPYQSAYIGFLWIFHITDGKNDGPIFCELVSSRDGINWTRQEALNGKRLPILPTGPKGAWDAGMVFTTNHPLVEGNKIKMWYGGSSATHSGREDSSRSGIGMATLRKDGFASLDAGATEGIVTSKRLKNVHGIFRVNANAANGWLKVELLGADGKVLPGFSRNDCNPVKVDDTDIPVTWRQHTGIPVSTGDIYIRFILKDASLYSFEAGGKVELTNHDLPHNIFIDFEKNNSGATKKISIEENKQPKRKTNDIYYRLKGKATIVVDSITSRKTSRVAKLQPASLEEPAGTIEVLHTTDLGPQFTLSARVKTTANKLTRLFSNYRGRGEFVTGELIFDFDPAGKELPGLRFTVNGQSIESTSLKFDDDKYHQLSVTYNFGKVILYLDGIEVGSGKIESGAARLTSSGSVIRHFELPNAMTEVGVHLGSNLLAGGDISGDFFNYKSKPAPLASAQLQGYVDDIVVERHVLSKSEISKINQKQF
ncbi:MAG: LamG-like jellyroll fold domain-containing protein, partial [Ginsengibacter sp.]